MDRAVYSTTVATLGFVCFTVAAVAVGLPLWGYFDNPEGESSASSPTILRVRPLVLEHSAAVCHFHLSLSFSRSTLPRTETFSEGAVPLSLLFAPGTKEKKGLYRLRPPGCDSRVEESERKHLSGRVFVFCDRAACGKFVCLGLELLNGQA